MSPDKVTRKAFAMKSFSLDGLNLLNGCRDSFFILHVQMWFSEEMFFATHCVLIITSKTTLFLKMARMTTDERNSRSAITNAGT